MVEKKESMVVKIYNQLKYQIITTRMVPGQLLMAQQLAIDHNASRTPVREALIRLKEEGLIEDAGGNKFKVSALSWKMVKDSYQARAIIEGSCVSYAAKNATTKDIKVLKDLINRMSKVNDDSTFSKYFELDQEFHFEIVKIMNNETLIEYMKKNTDMQQRIRYCTRGLNSNIKVSFEEHKQLLKAIENHDEKLASKLIHNHLNRAITDLTRLKEEEKVIPLMLIS